MTIARSSRSASPLAARAWEPYWPSSSATAARVASDSWSLASATSTRLRASWRAASSREISKPSRSVDAVASASAVVGLVDGRLDLDQAGLARRSAGGEVGTEEVSLARDGGDVGQVGHESTRGLEVVDDGDLVQQAHQRAADVLGRAHGVEGVRRGAGQGRPVHVVDGSPAQQQPGAAEVVGLEVADRPHGGVEVGDDHGVRRGSEGRGDRGLVAVLDVEERGHRAEQSTHLVGRREQCPGAVLAVEADLQGVAAGDQSGPVALGLLGLLACPGELLLDLVEGADGVLVLGVESLLAGVEAGDLGLEGGEVALGPLGAQDGVLAGVGEASDLGVGGLGPRRERVDLPVQPGQALAAVGGGTLQPGDAAVLLGGGLLGRALGRHGGLEDLALPLDLLGDLGLLAAHARGLGLELVGVAAGVDAVGLRGTRRVADALVGQRRGAAQPFLAAPTARTRSPGPRPAAAGRRAGWPRAGPPSRGRR